MNEQKDTNIPSKKEGAGKGGTTAASKGLSNLFDELGIHPESVAYTAKLAELGLNDVAALRNHASISFLQEQVGVKSEHIDRIMRKLYEIGSSDILDNAPHSALRVARSIARSIPPVSSFLSKENVVMLRQIGHGSSGRVFKALFIPTLTLIVIKDIEIKGAIEQRIVAQELKSIYRVALCDHIGGDVDQKGTAAAADSITETSGAPNTRAAHSPYLVGFYGAVSHSYHAIDGFSFWFHSIICFSS